MKIPKEKTAASKKEGHDEEESNEDLPGIARVRVVREGEDQVRHQLVVIRNP